MNPQTFEEWWRDGHSYLTRESAEAVFAETRTLVDEIQKEVIPRARTEALLEAADRFEKQWGDGFSDREIRRVKAIIMDDGPKE